MIKDIFIYVHIDFYTFPEDGGKKLLETAL